MTTGSSHSVTQLPGAIRRFLLPSDPPDQRHDALGAAAAEPCWIWTKSLNNAGYGQLKWRGKVWNVHRLVWHLLIEPLPQPGKARDRDGDVLDHICETRSCCNPHHIERITQSENTIRGARHR